MTQIYNVYSFNGVFKLYTIESVSPICLIHAEVVSVSRLLLRIAKPRNFVGTSHELMNMTKEECQEPVKQN